MFFIAREYMQPMVMEYTGAPGRKGGPLFQPDTVYEEDCLDTMARLPPGMIDLVVTSPPYDTMREYGGHHSTDTARVAGGLHRVVKDGGVVVWVTGDQTIRHNESGTSFRHALLFKEAGFNLFDTMIYLKGARGAVGNNRAYWQAFEYMFVFSKGRPGTINLLTDRPNKESRAGDRGTKRLPDGSLKKIRRGGYSGSGRRTNVWEYVTGRGHSSSDRIAHEHPAIFPEKLAEDHILSWSNPGDMVYDPFMGSGTVAKACIMNKRRYIGSEINPGYCSIIERRLEELRK